MLTLKQEITLQKKNLAFAACHKYWLASNALYNPFVRWSNNFGVYFADRQNAKLSTPVKRTWNKISKKDLPPKVELDTLGEIKAGIYYLEMCKRTIDTGVLTKYYIQSHNEMVDAMDEANNSLEMPLERTWSKI